MRALRRTACLLACLLCALGLAGSGAGAKRPPAAKPRSIPAMSAGIPYVAPWKSDFERYSTQLLPLPTTGGQAGAIVVPDGQWYRVVYASFAWITNGVGGARNVQLQATLKDGTIVLELGTPFAQPISTVVNYVYGPGLQAFANSTVAAQGQVQAPMPDVLWAPGTTLQWFLRNAQSGDALGAGATVAVEVYTPVKDRPGVLVPTPAIP